jgi:mono/diheme cytochrome c family protein
MKNLLKNQRAVILASLCLAGLILFSMNAKADAQAGAATFKTKCVSCHGVDGKGKAALKTQDMSSAAVQQMSDAELTAITTDGKGKMPAYVKSLKPDQIKDLVDYIRSLAKK